MQVDRKEIITPRQYKSWFSIKHQITEVERFDSEYEAERSLSTRQRIELAKQTLVVFAGAVAGIGVRLMTESDVNQLEKPGTYLGLLAIGAAYKMASVGLKAVDNHDLISKKIQGIRERKAAVKNWNKKEVIPYIEPKQLTLDDELEKIPQGERVIFVGRKISEIKTEQESTPKIIIEEVVVPEVNKEKIEVEESPAEKKTGKRASRKRASVNKAGSSVKTPDGEGREEDISKEHTEWRKQVIKEERRFLKLRGIIPAHRCAGIRCKECKKYDPVFV